MITGDRRADARCRELFERLSEYVDGELEPSVCAEIEEHMGDCAPCEAFLESLRRTVRLLGAGGHPGLSQDLRRDILGAVRRLRSATGGGEGEPRKS